MGASFTSGMDDFPRPLYSRGHVDLQSWMYFFTKFMIETAHIYSDSSHEYISNLELIKSNFQFFVDLVLHVYKDIANNTSHSEHFGYPNILPIAFGVPNYRSTEYNATIKMVKDHLDVGAGLSSISKHSPHYLENKGKIFNIFRCLLEGTCVVEHKLSLFERIKIVLSLIKRIL